AAREARGCDRIQLGPTRSPFANVRKEMPPSWSHTSTWGISIEEIWPSLKTVGAPKNVSKVEETSPISRAFPLMSVLFTVSDHLPLPFDPKAQNGLDVSGSGPGAPHAAELKGSFVDALVTVQGW